MTALLAMEDVVLVRGGRLLFQGFTLAVAAGETVQLLGPNGCGKSSLLRLSAGLLRAQAGRVEAAPLALADDHLALDRELSLGQALTFWGGDMLAEAIRSFGLDALVDVPVRYLSTGQKKRATLARVAASGAALWLLDEPANGLDPDGNARLAAAVARHIEGGGAVLAASHVPLPGQWRRVDLAR